MNKEKRNKQLFNKGFLDQETFDYLDKELAAKIKVEREKRADRLEFLKIEKALIEQGLFFG